MKKLVIIFCLLFLITGCEKKEPEVFTPNETLNLWVSGESEIWEALGLEFASALNLENSVIKVISFKNDSELQNELINQLAEKKGPDVIYTEGEWIFQNEMKLVHLVGDEVLTPEKLRSDFVQSVGETLVKENAILGVPMIVDSLALFYNEDHLLKHLKDRKEPGKTWKELESDVIVLTQKDNSFQRFSVSGLAIGRVDNINYGVDILENLLFQTVGNLFSTDGSEAIFAKDGGVTSDGKKIHFGLDAFDFFISFADPRFQNFSWNDLLASHNLKNKDFDAFVEGKVSMVFGYAHDLNKIKEIIKTKNNAISDYNVRVSFFPQFENNSSADRKVIARIKALAVPTSVKNKEFAWKFLKFAIQKENLRGFSSATNSPVPLLELLSEQESVDDLNIFVRQAKFANASLLPLSKTEFSTNFTELINGVNLSKISARDGVIQLQKEFTEQLIRKKELQQKVRNLEN